MSSMLTFCSSMLSYIANFLISPPIIYIISFLFLILIIKIFKLLIS